MLLSSISPCVLTLWVATVLPCVQAASGLDVKIKVGHSLLKGRTDGRIELMFAPAGSLPLDDTDVTSSPNLFFGQNAFGIKDGDTVTLSGGSGDNTRLGVYGWPNVSLDAVAAGDYTVQAFLNIYETAKRSDGSVVSIRFPCGDGAPNVDGFGSLLTSPVNVTVTGRKQTIKLTFDSVEPITAFNGTEIGGCYQGNYEDTTLLKRLKVRSSALSKFWGRDMYVGASVLLPAGYNAADKKTRYPVVYSQDHWQGELGPFRYPNRAGGWSQQWDKGIIPGNKTLGIADRAAPKMILVNFRHESPYYDDSYGVNTANIGPYGDAINDEMIPLIDKTFNTIAKPYARIQEGGSTGGWISAASVVFRPDLFGACFSSYPDSLDFHRHQDIHLYDYKNAYVRPDGTAVPSIRDFDGDTEVVLATTAQENHWELTFGTSSRSYNQWDVWNAVFGVQGYNNYPLEPWNKVTGEIYHEAVESWKPMDLTEYIIANWKGKRNLGKVLRHRMFVYVGSHDTYYLNEGVAQFQQRIDAIEPNWANVTVLANRPHGGTYNNLPIWVYLELLDTWFKDHAPNGKTPLPADVTTKAARGNDWSEVIARGGHKAAVARQAWPAIEISKSTIKASVGRWDPGVVLEAQWTIGGKPYGKSFGVKQGQTVTFDSRFGGKKNAQLLVTGSKIGYVTETRSSKKVRC